MLSPNDLVIECGLCRKTLDNPTTLHCGHSVCSAHLHAPSPSCPVPTCSQSPVPDSNPRIPPQSTVRYLPAPSRPQPALHLHPLRPDVSLNKIIALVARTQSRLDEPTPPLSDDENDDDPEPPRPRKRRKHYHDSEPDLLTHLRSTAIRSRAVPDDVPIISGDPVRRPDRASILAEFDKRLLEELTCQICYVLFFQPVTTPCQHTFCAKCLQRSLDHSPACPICRQELPNYSYFQDHPFNSAILSIIIAAYPLLYHERREAIEKEERHARLNTPIFVCQLSFPGTPTVLHFFEPKYRLMLRRCLETPNPRFGMIMASKPGTPQSSYGTMLEIKSVQMLPDGRSMVETWGSSRFRILERGQLDGYTVGRIERIDDYPDDLTEALDLEHPQSPTRPRAPSNEELMETCRAFLDRLQRGAAPWVVQRLSNAYGAIPADPALFSYWVALVLPIEDHEKAKLLPIRSARLRLILVVHWIEQLNNHWYAWLCFCFWEGWWDCGRGPLVPCLLWTVLVLMVSRLIGWI